MTRFFRTTMVTLAIGLSACSGTKPPPAASTAVPATLQPAAGEKRAFAVFARGVQIYNCTVAESGAAAWAFVAPQAELFDSASSGTAIGTHGAGPFWQSLDGSKVIGKVQARADAPAAGAIPWLLLSKVSTEGTGKMAAVTSIQRINTVGGVAPAGGCASKDDADKRVRVPYTSDYVFFAAGA